MKGPESGQQTHSPDPKRSGLFLAPQRGGPSLQRQLLIFLLLPLALLLFANGLLSLSQARNTAGLILDQKLLASARVMAQGIHVVDGLTEVQITPSAIEMLASPEHDMVYYQLRDASGFLLAGQADLASGTAAPGLDENRYSDLDFRGQRLRIVEISQPMPAGGTPRFARIIVGQTLAARDRLIRDLWLKGLAQQGLLVIASAALVWFGLKRGLAPLNRLREAMSTRKTGTLTPIDAQDAPIEVAPMVAALNDYIARLNLLMETQRRFIANAAHQLRTPLTLLKTQATFGLREASLAGKNEALSGLRGSLDHLTRLTNQLLVLARAEPGTNHGARVLADLDALARRLMEDFAPLALDRGLDLGFEAAPHPSFVHGNPTLLRELMANLIDNALRYTPAGGIVTVSLQRDGANVLFRVQDNGPGIDEAEREKVFERFYRVSGQTSEGSGLGLAIVQEILSTHDGKIEISTPATGQGLIMCVTLPYRDEETGLAR